MPSQHKRQPIPFRPPEGDRARLLALAERAERPVNAILREALAAYLDASEHNDGIAAAAAAVERELMSGRDYSMAADSDEALARAAVQAAMPIIRPAVIDEALMDAHTDLALLAESLETKGRTSGNKTHLGTAAGVRLAAFRLIELAARYQGAALE